MARIIFADGRIQTTIGVERAREIGEASGIAYRILVKQSGAWVELPS